MLVFRNFRAPLSSEEVESEVATLVSVFREIGPKSLYLFGSAATGSMTDQSDFDLIATFESLESLKAGMKAFARLRRKITKRALDVVWMLESEFEHKKEIGGVAFIAAREGKKLI